MPNERLKRARRKRGWSQENLAEQLQVSVSAINRWEQQKSRPMRYYRQKLTSLFQMSEEALGFSQEQEEDQGDQLPTQIFDPFIPPLPDVPLIGREREMEQVKQRLWEENNALTVLNGLPGVGKTALLLALAYDPAVRAHFRDGILWAGLGPEPNMQNHLNRWGTLLGLPIEERDNLRTPEAWGIALRRIIGTRSILLVLDDVWTVEDALFLKVGGPNCAHLVTTRSPLLATRITAIGTLAVRELDEDESLRLLHQLAPQAVMREEQPVRELAQALGGLPLALTLIGRYLRPHADDQSHHIAATLQRLSQGSERLRVNASPVSGEQHPGLPADSPISLDAVISATVRQFDKSARAALRGLSLFPSKPNSFSEDAALAATGCSVETLDSLIDAGVLEIRGNDRYSLHQTIADFARFSMDESPGQKSQLECIQATLGYYRALGEIPDPNFQDIERELSNILAFEELGEAYNLYALCLRLLDVFLSFFLTHGMTTFVQERVEAILHKGGPFQGEDQLRSLYIQASSAHLQEDLDRMEKSAREGAAFAREQQDLDWLLRFYWLLLMVYYNSNRQSLAREIAEQAWPLCEKVGWDRDVVYRVGALCHLIAPFVQNRTQFLVNAIAQARVHNMYNPLIPLLQEFANVMAANQNYEGAEAAAFEGLALARSRGRPGAELYCLWTLAKMCHLRGDDAREERYWQEACELNQKLGVDIVSFFSYAGLSKLLLKRQDILGALSMAHKACSLAEKRSFSLEEIQEDEAFEIVQILSDIYHGLSDHSTASKIESLARRDIPLKKEEQQAYWRDLLALVEQSPYPVSQGKRQAP